MIKGFNRWQVRIALVSVLGVVIGLIGTLGPWLPVIVAGAAIAALCIPALLLLSGRQVTREIKKARRALEARSESKQALPAKADKRTTKLLPIPGASHEYARRIQQRPSHYETFALMSKSVQIRDAFALAATQFQMKDHELSDFVALQRMSMLPRVKPANVSQWSASAFLALARLKANQRAVEKDLEDAARMFSFAETMFGLESLSYTDRLIYLEALGELKQFDKQLAHARRLHVHSRNPSQLILWQLNAINASSSVTPEWVDQLNELYVTNEYSSVELLKDTKKKPLDRLSSSPIVAEEGPKVSVLVPTFQGGSRLHTALNSLLNQTWRNLEIIVVDDGSGSENEAYLSDAERLDPRIKVLRQRDNAGAYAARNAGAKIATGDYVTVHDDDDWSHSEKISLQVRHLINNPDIPGNLSTHTRVTEDLKFLRINNNPILAQANYSSLMVRRSIFQKIGYWDPVNRGADSEFRARIRKYYGVPVKTLETVPLSFTRTREGSLTSGELSRGYLDPARVLYSKAYQQWHNSTDGDLELLKPNQPRRFPVPSTMQTGMRHAHLGEFDVVYLTDYRFPGGTSSLTLREIEISSDAGYRIGYIHIASPLNRANAPIQNKLFKLQLEGRVTQIGLQDKADINLLVVRHPSVATYMDGQMSRLEVKKTILIVNNPPVLPNAQGMVFDLRQSLDNLDRVFRTRTELVAESGVTRKLCHGLVPSNRLSVQNWPGVVETSPVRQRDFSKKPTVGRHSRDHELKWPTNRQEFQAAYHSPHFNTSFLGGTDTLEKKLGKDIIADVETFEFGELEVTKFLQTIDFWVYFHDKQLSESFGMSIAEAMAAGKVVILPQYLRETFGEGAIYAKPSDVENVVTSLWSDPVAYAEQSRLARDYVISNFSASSFLERLRLTLEDRNADNE